MAGLYSHTTRATGTTLTASIYNTDHQNHIDNHVTSQMDDYSSSVAEMKTTTDPYPAASESQATTLAGELERIRYLIKQITGETEWYIDPDDTIASMNSTISGLAGASDVSSIIATQMFNT